MADDTTHDRTAAGRDQPGDIHETVEEEARPSNLQKDPDQWSTGGETMTDAQRSYLTTLSQEAGEEPPGDLTKAEASKRIDQLQQRTGRGVDR